MNQKVQAVLKLKVEQFTEIAAQEEAIELATIESAKAIRKLQDNGVTMDEAADSTGLSVNPAGDHQTGRGIGAPGGRGRFIGVKYVG